MQHVCDTSTTYFNCARLCTDTLGTYLKEEKGFSLNLRRYNRDGHLFLFVSLQVFHDVLDSPSQNADKNADTLGVNADLKRREKRISVFMIEQGNT